jgi:hypothetical protein
MEREIDYEREREREERFKKRIIQKIATCRGSIKNIYRSTKKIKQGFFFFFPCPVVWESNGGCVQLR